ncbi:hypothetical protein AV656_10830 [Bhargavaea cecembensis]|uniref:HTH cro/C1-type domain-containing protein n=1 Tax=Bhargavaea cecembensis TaxID=394098 RepID=A0A163ES67_9BACL|nr:helix-turn-helix transcriptional regulator [Bhargavaea cecembensis]KZE37071.1 hypothetical protein AV656_10830 [Bhargavaea cecembensis]
MNETLTFGERLKALRIQHDVSPDQLAEKIGVAKSLIWTFELDKKLPTYPQLIALADYFEVTTDYLLNREPVSVDMKQAADDMLDKYELCLDGRRLSKDELLDAMTFIRTQRTVRPKDYTVI